MSHTVSDFNNFMKQNHLKGTQEFCRLHIELDQTVLAAYGWTDQDLVHTFVEEDTLTIPETDRTRYTITPAARKELLKRLLSENHKRAKVEKAVGKTNKGQINRMNTDQMDLLEF